MEKHEDGMTDGFFISEGTVHLKAQERWEGKKSNASSQNKKINLNARKVMNEKNTMRRKWDEGERTVPFKEGNHSCHIALCHVTEVAKGQA